VDDGVGSDSWTVTGTADVTGHGGSPVFNVGSQGSLSVTGPLGYMRVQNTGGSANFAIAQGGAQESGTFTGGSWDLQVYSATMVVSTAASPIGATLNLTSGTANVTSLGHDVIWAGSGNDTIIVKGNAEIHAGTGTLAVYGRSSPGATLYGNGGDYYIGGDTGNIKYYGGDKASTVELHLSNNTLNGGAGLLTVNGGSREVMNGGAGGLNYNAIDGGGANTISTAVGATDTLTLAGADTVVSWGNDLINGGFGNQSLDVHGNSMIIGSTGSSHITLWGTDTLVGNGVDFVTAQAGSNVSITAGKTTQVWETGAQVHYGTSTSDVVVCGGAAQVSNGAGGSVAITTQAGTSTNVVIGAGNATLTSAGADNIHAGSGTDTIVLSGTGTQVWGGNGSTSVSNVNMQSGNNTTIHGCAGSINVTERAGQMTFIGGSGNAVITGQGGTLYVTGGVGNVAVSTTYSALQFTGGAGDAQLSVGSTGGVVTFGSGTTSVKEFQPGAADIFNFVAGSGGGHDTITGFRVGIDQIALKGVSVVSQAASGGGTLVTLSDNTTLQLAGIANTHGIFS
jgi:hypothetical protein